MADNSDSDYGPGKNDDDEDNKSEVSSKSDNLSEDGNSWTKSTKTGIWKKPSRQVFPLYLCSLCNYETHLRYNLKRHLKCCKQSNTKNRLKCPRCDKVFTEIELLNEYKLPVNVDDQGNHVFHCPFCKRNKEKKRKTSILEIYNIKSKYLVCTDCGIKIQGMNGLKKHMIITHSKTVQYRCEYCEYCSLKSSDLQKHKQSHSHQQEIGFIKCSHCTRDFFTIEEFREHMRIIQNKKYNEDIKEIDTDIAFPEERSTDIEALLNDLEDNVSDVENKDNEDNSKYEKEAGQLLCSLCQYVHHSEENCYRHVKDKHRAEGYTAVTFHKYDGPEFKGSIVIGKRKENLVSNNEDKNKRFSEKNQELDNKCNSMELLNALNLMHADHTLENDKENNEVITIQFVSDSEDGSILDDNNINISLLEDEQLKPSRNDKITADITIPESEEKVSDYNIVLDKQLECTTCSYKTTTNSYLLIHKQLLHNQLIDGGFKCSHKNCLYTSNVRKNFWNHLKQCHKNNITMFYSKDLNCPDCDYIGKKHAHLLSHIKHAHLLKHRKHKHKNRTLKSKIYKRPHCSFVTSHDQRLPQHVQKSTKADTNWSISKSAVVKCPLCGIATINKYSGIGKHLKICKAKHIPPAPAPEVEQKYLKFFSCRYCGREHDKLYQLAWHIYIVHKISTDLQKWLLKCEKCNYEHYSKVKCHEHGLQHKTTFLTFQKFYQGIPKGKLRMRYLRSQFKDNLDDVIDTSSRNLTSLEINTKKDLPIENTNTLANNNGEQYTSKASIDIMDWTHSDDEKNDETYKNHFKSKIGKKASTKDVLNSNNENTELFEGDDDLLKKKAEYFTCSKCSYETNCSSHVPLHEKLVHGDPISRNKAEYKCPNCAFETKYRHNLKRHLIGSHNFDITKIYTVNQEQSPTPSKKKTNNGNIKLQQCCLKHTNKYSRAWHVYKKHRDKSELLKWRIDCTLCSYTTYLKDQARQHAEARHSGAEERVVTFNTFYENELVGCFDFKIEKDSSNGTTEENNLDVNLEIPEIIKIEITPDDDNETNPNKKMFQIEDQKSVPTFREVISNKNQKRRKNKYIFLNKKSVKKHKPVDVSKQNKLGDKYKVSENAVCNSCKCTFEDKYELAIHLYKAHRDKTEIGKWAIKCSLCDFKSCWIKNASIHGRTRHGSKNQSTTAIFQMFYETEFKKVVPFHYGSQPYSCNKCDFLTDNKKGIEEHKSRHKREIKVSRLVRNKSVSITKNKMENLDSNNKLSNTCNAVEDCVGGHFEESNTSKINQNQNINNSPINIPVNENEVITIEIVPDKADISSEGERSIENSELDPFTGEYVEPQLINNKKLDDKAITLEAKPKIGEFKCSKVGCKYSCGSLEKIIRHLKFCNLKNPLMRNNIKVTCNLCHKVIPDKRFIQMHCNKHAISLNNPVLVVSFSEFIGNKHICDIEVNAKLDSNPQHIQISELKAFKQATKITFKCWMCGYLFSSKITLRRHTQIHAREDGNPTLKVRYSEYRDDEIGATIIMHANPDYVFPKRSDRERSPELEYDSSLDVFSCGECNFKTNHEDELNKHKNLHWTPKKAALFKAQKWFTCSECFFYCFDLDQFKKHGEWHKTHPKSTGNIGKLGKDSWFLK